MRVGFVTGEYPPMQGGVGAFTQKLAHAMVNLGHEACVFTRKSVQDAAENSVQIFPLVEGRWGWSTTRLAQSWVRRENLDLVNIQFQTAAYDMHPAIHWLPRQLDTTPVVVTFHDLRFPYLFPKAGKLRTWIVCKLAHGADGVIATDRADEATLQDKWSIPHVQWIPIGSNVTAVPPTSYKRKAWRAKMGIGPENLLISYFGFLNESKGGLDLIEALSRLAAQGIPVHLVMIGGRAGDSDPTNARYGAQVDELIKQHGLAARVHWTGFVEDEQVSAYFYASDITVLPYLDGASLRRGTLMAALVHGRAIVTTKPQIKTPELEGAVVTVPTGNPESLARVISHLWQAPHSRRRLERAAEHAARYFSWENIAHRTLEFFSELVSA